MASLRTFSKLPGVFQTDAQRRFFQATFEQLFSKKNVEELAGYIGLRVPGRYDPINDYYLAEPTKERTYYQLEATSYALDSTTLDQTNVMFYQDLLNRINYFKGITNNNDRLFSSGYYSFAPPIDLDKFINFQNYFWLTDKLPVIELQMNAGASDILVDAWVETNLLGKTSFTTTYNGSPLVFSNGLRIKITNSKSFNQNLTVEGVGKGIILVPDQSQLTDVVSSEDYVTIERGCVDGNPWSRTNKWYHKTLIATVSSLTGTTVYDKSTKAKRPIIEFDRDIELFKSGSNYIGEVNLAAATDLPTDIIGQASYSVDGKSLEEDDTLIFLGDNQIIQYGEYDSFIAGRAPYSCVISKPFVDTDEKYVIVYRGDKVFYNPEWYSYEDQINTMYFTANTKGLQWENINTYTDNDNFGDVSNGTTVQFYSTTVTENITQVDILYRGTQTRVDRDSYTWTATKLSSPIGKYKTLISVNLVSVPTGQDFSLLISDDMGGLLPEDHVEININNKIREYYHPATDSIEGAGLRKTFIFDDPFEVTFTQSNLEKHIIGVKVQAYSRDVNGDPIDKDFLYDPTDSNISVTIGADNTLLIKFASPIPDDSTVGLYVRDNEVLKLNSSEFIWKSVFVNDGSGGEQLQLHPYPSKTQPANTGDVVLITEGTSKKGQSYYFNGSKWTRTYNQKTSINQAPLFNLYYTNLDSSGNPVSLDDFYMSTFDGNKIFSYKINEESAYNDPVLGFPIEYTNLGQISDIVFQHNLQTDRYQYMVDGEYTDIIGYYYFKRYNYNQVSRTVAPTYDQTWVPFSGNSQQRVIDRFVVSDTTVKEYTMSVVPNKLEEGIYDVRVDLNKDTLSQGSEFTVVEDINGNPTNKLNIIRTLAANDVVQSYTYSKEALPADALGYYEIPQQLENNPNNLEVSEYSSNDLTNHFVSIMTNQIGFSGDPYSSSNNYRDTAEDLSLGTYILQNRNPLLKTMLISSSDDLDVISSIRFARDNYTRYKDKFLKYSKDLLTTVLPISITNDVYIDQQFNYVIGRVTSSFEYNGAFTKSYMLATGDVYDEVKFASNSTGMLSINTDVNPLVNTKQAVLVYKKTSGSSDYSLLMIDSDYNLSYSGTELTITLVNPLPNDSYSVRLYNDPVSCKIPATPSKLGCYPVYRPKKIVDDTYLTPTEVIVGHDGSKTPAFGDIRDDLLLELETRIYNNINPIFRSDYDLLLKTSDVRPTFFNKTEYSVEEYNNIVKPYFLKWRSKNGLNYKLHSGYDSNQWKTWNFSTVAEKEIGSWRGLYKYYYSTMTPNTTPWEMLGFAQKPSWWDTEYSTDYTSSNYTMWNDIELGYIKQGNRAGINASLARPGLVLNYMPVDSQGNLKNPLEIGLVASIPQESDLEAEWKFGDNGPVEEAWYTSSEWPFVQMESLYLMKPAAFGERFWDPADDFKSPINQLQYVSRTTLDRKSNSEIYVHGETVNGEVVVTSGYQQYITDRLTFMGKKDITYNFGSKIRTLDVCLAHRLAGFTNIDTLNVYADTLSSSSSNSSMLLPKENIHVKVYTGQSIKEYVFSGVAIRITEDNKFEVRGYDLLTPVFYVVPRSSNGTATQINIGGTTASFVQYSTDRVFSYGEIVRYNGTYYQCAVPTTTAGRFVDTNWLRLKSLPQTGGVSVSYIADGDYSSVYEVEYGSVLDTVQDVFDFLIGHGQYLEANGWIFDEVDNDTNQIQDWLLSAKGFMFWSATQWAPNNTLFVAPGSTRLKLEVSEGYPQKVERIANGVYSILDQNGYALSPSDTHIDRNMRTISVKHDNDNVGIYSFRVSTSDTEHAIMFDNTTIFNDVIYDPLLFSRQKRLEVEGFRSAGWYGKLEADGYIISDDKMIQNFENLTDSIWYYYDTEVTLDNPDIEETARHLIGFQEKEYLDNLRITGDQQYLFYKGMIPQKGTKQSVDKLLRSEFIQSNDNIQLYEEFAFKLGEFGATNDNAKIEVLIDGNLIKTDPQIVDLRYPISYGTGVVSEVRVLSAEHTYTSIPTIVIASPEEAAQGLAPDISQYQREQQVSALAKTVQTVNSQSIATTRAKAEATLTAKGKLSSITITNAGSGYTSTPIVVVLNSGEQTSDKVVSLIQNEITEDSPYDLIITIDSDDRSKWLTKPTDRLPVLVNGEIKYTDRLVPYTKALDPKMLTAGYVSISDVTHQSFDVSSLFSLWTRKDITTPTSLSYIWVAKCDSIGFDWGVFRIVTGVPVANNAIPGYCVIGNALYTYTTDEDDLIDHIYDNNGTEVTNVDFSNPSVFKLCRYKSTSDIDVNDGLVWIDSYNGGWAHASVTAGSVKYLRQQQNLVDSKLFENAYFYDPDTAKTIVFMPVYDPVKGLIPGIADRNLTYKTDIDPARYTNASNSSFVDHQGLFGNKQVGLLWWDMSTCRYLQYEQPVKLDGSETDQDILEYRRNHWGELFTGSEVNVYEWVSSSVTPDQWQGTGTPRNTTDYVDHIEISATTGLEVHTYYFWVKGKNEVPKNLKHRSMTSSAVESLISNPKSNGYEWFAFIGGKSFVFANVTSEIKGRSAIFQVNYRFTNNINPVHKEWKLLREGDDTSFIPNSYWNKMVDSLVGYDKLGNVVPDPYLSEYENLGVKLRPRQTMFKDKYAARKVMMQNANVSLAKISILDTNPTWADSLTSKTLWKYVNWYADGYNSTNAIPTKQISTVGELSSIESSLTEGDIVKLVQDGVYSLYVYESGSFTLIGRQNSAIQLLDRCWNVQTSYSVDSELRDLLTAISNGVFTDTNIVYRNLLFFALVNYALSEQENLDWIFKTTYVKVNQEGQSLTQDNSLTTDPISSFISYINEIKPYSTKIRDLGVSYSVPTDLASGYAYDFDSLYSWGTDHSGETAPYLPTDVPRLIDVHSMYDRVQCGYVSKPNYIDLGDQTIIGVSGQVEYIVHTEDDVFVGDSETTSYHITDGKDITRVSTVQINGNDITGYTFVSKLNTWFLVLPTAPADNDVITVKYIDITSVWKVTLDGREIDRAEYSTFIGLDGYLHIVFNDSTMVRTNNKVRLFSGTEIIQTPLEEMRLEYNARQPGEVINPVFDLEIDPSGKLAGGWGVPVWGQSAWGNAGGRVEANRNLWTTYAQYSGAAGRYIQYQTDLQYAIRVISATAGKYKYSTFSERTYPSTVSERNILQQFNERFGDEYGCNYQGKTIDAREFEYIFTQPWDTVGWDTTGWDQEIATVVITPNFTLSNATLTSEGRTTYIIRHLVNVTGVTVNGVSATFTSTKGANFTSVEIPSSVLGDSIVITFDPITGTFESDESKSVIDGDNFNSDLESNIPDEQALVNPTENLVITVDVNSNYATVSHTVTELEANNLPFYIDLGKKVNMSDVMGLVINGDKATTQKDKFNVDNTGSTTVVIAYPTVSPGDVVEARYYNNYLTQMFTASDYRWDANSTIREQSGYLSSDMRSAYSNGDIGSWDSGLWDPVDEVYTSAYLLPVDMPLSVDPAGVIAKVYGTTPVSSVSVTANGTDVSYNIIRNVAVNQVTQVRLDGSAALRYTLSVDASGNYPELRVTFDVAPNAGQVITVEYISFTIMSVDEYSQKIYNDYAIEGTTLADYTESMYDMLTGANCKFINKFYGYATETSTSRTYDGYNRVFTVPVDVNNFVEARVYVNESYSTLDRDYKLELTNDSLVINYTGLGLSAGDAVDIYVTVGNEEQVRNRVSTSNMVVFDTSHVFVDPETGTGDVVTVQYPLKPVSFRVHLDEVGESHYIRISDYHSTTLASDLTADSKSIEVTNITAVPNATKHAPGVIWIGSERIEYLYKRGNRLYGLTRGSLGTSLGVYNGSTTIPSGTKVFDGSSQQQMDAGSYIWENNGGGLALSTTEWAKFLQTRPGSALSE